MFYTGSLIKGSNALAIDGSGTIYIANQITNSILRISAAGFLSPFAVGGGLAYPVAMAFDSGGNLFVANGEKNGSVSKITPAGLLSTFYIGIALQSPSGIAIDRDDTVFVADYLNATFNRITPSGSLTLVAASDTLYQTRSLILGGGGDVFFTRNQSGSIYRRSGTGTVGIFSPGRATITALALGPNPIPEPSGVTLSIVGVAGCFLTTRRGRRNKSP